MNTNSSAKRRAILVWVTLSILLLFGTVLRSYNLDEVRNVDEPNITKRAAYVADGQWHIKWYNWPAQSLIRLNAIPFKVAQVVINERHDTQLTTEQLYNRRPVLFLTIAHAMTVLFAFGSLILVFFIAKEIRGPGAGLLATLFLSVNYLHNLHSKYATPDVPMTFTFLLATYLALLLISTTTSAQGHTKRIWWLYGIGGGVVGLAIATKYTGALAIVPLLLAHVVLFFKSYDNNWKQAFRKIYTIFNWPLLAGAVAGLVVHTMLNPFFFFDLNEIINQIRFESKGGRMGVDWNGKEQVYWLNFWYYLRGAFAWNGTLITIFGYSTGLLSLLWIRNRNWLRSALLTGFLLLVTIGLSTLGLHWSRWAVPFTVYIVLLAAIGTSSAYAWLQHRARTKPQWLKWSITAVFGILVVIAVLPQALISAVKSYGFSQTGTTQNASTYIQKNLSVDDSIISDTYYVRPGESFRIKEIQRALYNTTVNEHRDAGYTHIMVKASRLGNAKKEPKKYANIIQFFEDLDSSATLLKKFPSTCESILDHKRDYKVYQYFFNHPWDEVFRVCKGTELWLYKL